MLKVPRHLCGAFSFSPCNTTHYSVFIIVETKAMNNIIALLSSSEGV